MSGTVEKVKAYAATASKERLFQKVKEVEVSGRRYVIRRPSRKEMFETGLQLMSNLLDDLRRMIERETDLERKRKLWEEYLKTQYDYERKLLLTCVEGIGEEDIDAMDYGEYYALVNQVVDFVYLAPLRELSERRSSQKEPTPVI